VCLYMLQQVFQITGPCSRILQSTSADIAVASQLIRQCRQKLDNIRAGDNFWQSLLTDAQQFATAHDVDAEFLVHRARRPTRQHDEARTASTQFNSADHWRINVYYTLLDTVARQLQDRFHDDTIGIFEEMEHLTPKKLMTEEEVSTDKIANLCNFYDLDPQVVTTEHVEFRHAYRVVQDIVPVNDLISDDKDLQRLQELHLVDDIDGSPCNTEENIQLSNKQWIECSYAKPLRVLWQLAGYPTLTSLYKILASLAVTSCSAERVMSRIRIVKNRLRSTMVDDWFAPLTVLACEREVTLALNQNDIVDLSAVQSAALQKHLL